LVLVGANLRQPHVGIATPLLVSLALMPTWRGESSCASCGSSPNRLNDASCGPSYIVTKGSQNFNKNSSKHV
jgi:hypothetical protein